MNNAFVRWLLDLDRIPADAEAVRFAWERPFPGWVWLLVILGALLFAFWSYARIAGDRKGRGVLAVVRTLIILTLLVIISGPMLELPRTSVEEDWVLLLADRSQSMQIADAPKKVSDTFSARATRDEQLEETLAAARDTWNALDAERHLLWLGFHDGAFELAGPGDDAQSAPPNETTIDLGDPSGRRTNLASAIEQALQKAAARPISGVVVFSDGRTIDPPSRSLIRRLQADQIAVFVVPLGSDEALGDLAVRRVDAPRRAFVRDKVPVVVELDRFGEAVRDMPAAVRLVDADTGAVLDEVELDPSDPRDAVTLTAEPKDAGDAKWRIEIATAESDLIPDNNIKALDIELIDRPLRVLYVEGYPRWEYQFLKSILVREKSIESAIMLVTADRDFAQEGNTPITRLPRSPEEFAAYDVIILGDINGTYFSPPQLEMMRDHIADRGAGFLWIGGERFTPSTYTGTAAALADLLPIRGSLALPRIDEPVNMIPTTLAERLGVLRLVSAGQVGWPVELEDPSYRWSQLQWAQKIDPRQLKPTAQVLATTTAEFDGGEKLPLVMHMRYGDGQVIYVATDETWRWRYGRGELLPEQFWVQMIRMLGRETLAGADDPAILSAEPRRVAIGQPMQVALRLLDSRLAGLDLRTIRATLEDQDGATIVDLELTRVDGETNEYLTTFIPAVVGEFRVRVDDPSIMIDPMVMDVEVFNPENELRRPETDHPLLARLAEETGGAVLDAAALSTLPQLLPNRSVRTPNPLTERIWDTPLFFILILLALTGEWVGRKLLRLA